MIVILVDPELEIPSAHLADDVSGISKAGNVLGCSKPIYFVNQFYLTYFSYKKSVTVNPKP